MPRRWVIAFLLSWGLSLGILAAFGCAVMLLGFGWVFLYGDGPWPAQFTGVAVPVVAAVAGVGAFLGMAAAAAHVRRAHPGIEHRLQRNHLLCWGVLVAPALLVFGLYWAIAAKNTGSVRAELEGSDKALSGRHQLTDSAWRLD